MERYRIYMDLSTERDREVVERAFVGFAGKVGTLHYHSMKSSATKGKLSGAQREILAKLAPDKRLTNAEINKGSGVNHSTTFKILNRMVAKGRLQKEYDPKKRAPVYFIPQ